MRIKDILWIVLFMLFIRVFIISNLIYSSALKVYMLNQVYGFENPSIEILFFLDKYILMILCFLISVICLILRSIRMTDLDSLRNLSFQLFVLMSFFGLPQVINTTLGVSLIPLTLIFLIFVPPILLFYGYKRGTI